MARGDSREIISGAVKGQRERQSERAPAALRAVAPRPPAREPAAPRPLPALRLPPGFQSPSPLCPGTFELFSPDVLCEE